jgi:hypothetical protein
VIERRFPRGALICGEHLLDAKIRERRPKVRMVRPMIVLGDMQSTHQPFYYSVAYSALGEPQFILCYRTARLRAFSHGPHIGRLRLADGTTFRVNLFR